MYTITQMKVDDIPSALSIWHDQFNRYCKNESFPDYWEGGKLTIENYVLRQAQQGNAIVAKLDNAVVGYMAWMYFDFHSERSVLLPTVGNAAAAEDETAIYHAMYTAASQKWVRDSRFNHLWMTFYDDLGLKEMLYDVGFGSYVIDACQKTNHSVLPAASPYKITNATEVDADAVLALADASERNLYETPIFLVRELWHREDIVKLIRDEQVFIAWDNDHVIGVFSFDINQKHHFEHLTCANSAYIGGIGVYVKPEYRGKGVGTQLVRHAFDYCHKVGKPFLHVSYESANPYANRFWRKHFKPAIRSVRRTINKDANTKL